MTRPLSAEEARRFEKKYERLQRLEDLDLKSTLDERIRLRKELREEFD